MSIAGKDATSQYSRNDTRADAPDSPSARVLGLYLSKRLFETRGGALLARLNLLDRCSVGCIGGTSQNARLDDEISRDHMWGPYLSFLLPEDDWNVHHDRLAQAVAEMPEEVDGFRFYGNRNTPRKSDVYVIGAFLRMITGMDSRPESDRQWLPIIIKERFTEQLFDAGQGEVFHDPRNQFIERWRNRVAFVPPDIQKALIARTLSRIWNAGPEYNLKRIWARNKRLGFDLCFSEFINRVFELAFYWNDSFVPFYKWREAHFYNLRICPDPIRIGIERLSDSPDVEEKIDIAKAIVASVKLVMRDLYHLDTSLESPLFVFAQAVHDTIEDPEIRKQIPAAS